MKAPDDNLLGIRFGKDIPPSEYKDDDSNDADSLDVQKRRRFSQDTKYRKTLADWVMWVVSDWLVLVMALLFLCGYGLLSLSDAVLTALLATTTINILGLASLS